jgi:hypothetical protein
MSNALSISLLILSFSFATLCIFMSLKLKKSKLYMAKLLLENFELNKYAEKIQSTKELDDNDIHRENFIKFLSDSRDWAFTYIEDVQNGLTKFVEEVDPTINYFLEFSTIQEGNPLNNGMKKISVAYLDLKKFLPSDPETKNS